MFADWLFVTGCAAWLAAMEVQIEGGYGWSAKTATWRVRNPLKGMVGWPYVSGYHLAAWVMTLGLFHMPFLFEHALTWKNWVQILELWWGFWMIDDFWWFVINPLWGLKKFLTQEIPWHPGKLFYLPKDYWLGGAIWIGLEVVRNMIK